ncbi:MAG: HTH-type transcriptional repressor FabR [Abyssibacter sp.]|uniref:HTH-type transcriptional repressor FabR n=1 Tax=Abyssibacter sp. TaxID=2320200 RepID=UPI00321B6154
MITRQDIIDAALRLIGPHRSVSTLSLREVTREAGIAPNSFYRHFRDVDELAVALIDMAGQSLRQIIRDARLRVSSTQEVTRPSVMVFMSQLASDAKLLHVLLCEGTVGSDAFKQAVERELQYFEDELCTDLVRLAEQRGQQVHAPALAAKAITRLVFALGGTAIDASPEEREAIADQMVTMVRMIIFGAQAMAMADPDQLRQAGLLRSNPP